MKIIAPLDDFYDYIDKEVVEFNKDGQVKIGGYGVYKDGIRKTIEDICFPVTLPSTSNFESYKAEVDSVIPYIDLPASSLQVRREKEQSVKTSPRVSPSMASSNQFDSLDCGIDMLGKELDPYLGIPDLGSASEVLKTCLNNHDIPEARI